MSTLAQLRSRVRTNLDLLDEPAVTDSEIDSYLNEGIDVIEAKILGLYEDYFLKRGTAISLVAGQAEYDYPADLWGNKLRALIYRSGTTVHEIPRQGPQLMNSFLESELAEAQGSGTPETMSYRPLNSSFRLSPPPGSNEASVLIPWYIRQALPLSADADECDIPEWEHVAVAYAEHKITLNKPGLGDKASSALNLEALTSLMEESLANRVPDQWDLVDFDTSTYQEHT